MFYRKGLTLTELLVAMVIIAIAAVGSLDFFRICQQYFIVNSTLKLRAANLCRGTMEGLYTDPGGDALIIGNNHPVTLPTDLYGVNGWGGSYDVSQGTDSGQGSNYKVITLTIRKI
ncbi:MAG: prepilin-type N-terminal cleavage/methylation domain-containing protein [Candidatus Omnitrophota bacterium]|nr:prepilin-type N-terminal cleavage/methylation domain-containing protein [Candidatus Omnitrophota bacterium]